MTGAFVALIVAGAALATAAGASQGLDPAGAVILGLILGVGALGVAVSRRAGAVAPARCERCGGLVSRNAPYCSRCRAPAPERADDP